MNLCGHIGTESLIAAEDPTHDRSTPLAPKNRWSGFYLARTTRAAFVVAVPGNRPGP